MEINGRSYEVPNIPRAQELEEIFEGLDDTAQETYSTDMTRLLERGAGYDTMSAREKATYRGDLQRLIDRINASIESPDHSPAVSHATIQEIITILHGRRDVSRPHIRDAIRRLEIINLGDENGLSDSQRERISEELGELLQLIESDSNETQSEQIVGAVGEVRDLYDRYIEERREVTARAEAETADENFDMMVARAREITLDGRIDRSDWDEVLPLLRTEFEAESIELSDEDYQKLEAFINAIRTATESASIGISAIDSMLDHILDEAENSDGSGPLEVTVNETWLTNDIIEGFTDGESPITFLRNTLHEWIPDRIDAVADGEAFNITFENREEAVTFVTGVKQELADMQEIDVFDTLSDYAWAALIFTGGLALDGLWTIDQFVLDAILLDFGVSTSHWAVGLVSAGLHTWGLFYLRNRLRVARSGVEAQVISQLTDNLRATIEVYREAGFSDEEIRNLQDLYDSITRTLPETPAGINDQEARARHIYIQLQRWRGNQYVDQARFVAASIGNELDRNWSWTPTAWVEDPNGDVTRRIRRNGTFTTVRGYYSGNFGNTPYVRRIAGTLNSVPLLGFATRNAERVVGAHLYFYGSIGNSLINRGPNGWRLMYTKSDAIGDYANELERSNARFRQLFDIVDGIDEFTTRERTALKRRILNEYRGPTTRLDPLRRYNFELSLLGGSERQNLFAQLESDLGRQGIAMRVNNILDFHRGLNQLPESGIQYYRRLLRSFISAPRVLGRTDERAAIIIRNEIQERLGYVPEGIEETLEEIRNNSTRFEAQRESISASRTQLLRFINFYPSISDVDEARLIQISNTESLVSSTQEDFRARMETIFRNQFRLDVTSASIDNFLVRVEAESIKMGESRNNARVRQEIERILRIQRDTGSITEIQFTEINGVARDFFQGNKTFWQPHLGLIIEDIINGRMIDGTHSVAEVQNFLDRGGDTDVFNYLDSLRQSAEEVGRNSGVRPTTIIEPENNGEGRGENPDSTREETSRLGSEYLRASSNFRNGYIAFELELEMRGIDLGGVSVSDYFRTILNESYPSREALFIAMNEKLTTDGYDIQIEAIRAARLGEIQQEHLTYRQIVAEDIYRRYLLSQGGEINERTIGAIRSSSDPMRVIGSIDITSVPEWDDPVFVDRITISESTLRSLRSTRQGAWRNDGGFEWRRILSEIQRAS